MEDIKAEFGERFLKKANRRTNWYMAFGCICLREKIL